MSVLLKFTWCSILWIRQFIFIVYILGLTVIFSIITISFSFLKVPVKIRIFLVRMWSVLARYGIFLILWLRIKTEGKINYLSIIIILQKSLPKLAKEIGPSYNRIYRGSEM